MDLPFMLLSRLISITSGRKGVILPSLSGLSCSQLVLLLIFEVTYKLHSGHRSLSCGPIMRPTFTFGLDFYSDREGIYKIAVTIHTTPQRAPLAPHPLPEITFKSPTNSGLILLAQSSNIIWPAHRGAWFK